MNREWREVERWLMGDAWIGSRLNAHVAMLCEQIGVRWAGTDAERRAAEYVLEQFHSFGLADAAIEGFPLQTSSCLDASLKTAGDPPWSADVRPCLFCPSVDLEAPLADAGHGMSGEIAAMRNRLPDSIALVRSEFAPFSDPVHLTRRLRELATAGVRAAITATPHDGRRLTHVSAGDWREGDPRAVPLPLVQTSREDFACLTRRAREGQSVRLRVETEFRTATSWNVCGELTGADPDDGCLILGAHHDTTPDSFGANDNGAGIAVLLETARLLAAVRDSLGQRPGRTIRFVAFGAEEQGLQGSFAFVRKHYPDGSQSLPRLMIALDELATGAMKGVVLQFPELRDFVQSQLDRLGEGLEAHVLSQMDASGDMFPFAQRGIPSSFLWRWRFIGRHPSTAFGHSSSDTMEKLRPRELKEYAGLLSRLLVRLSLEPAEEWPENQLDTENIARRIEAESGAVFRTM